MRGRAMWWGPGLLCAIACLLLTAVAAAQGDAPADAPPAEEADTPAETAPPEAAPDPDAAKKDEAKQRFLRGIELVQNEDWEAALAEFEASLELFPTRVALKNAALSLRQLKRYAEALSRYEELKEKYASELGDDAKVVDDAIAKLRKLVGEITVTSDQQGSTVIVDGSERGTTPLRGPIRVKAGTHTVRVYKEGFEPFQQSVRVAGAQRKNVTAKLKALTRSGRLKVTEASGKELDVVVDGAVVGRTPWEGSLAEGTHTVYLRGPDDTGTPPSAATVKLGATSTLTLRAGKLDAVMRIEPVPSNALVSVDGVEIGAGIWEGRLESGPHKIEVTARGHLAYQRTVTVKSGQREVLRVSLERDPNDPMWAASERDHLFIEAVGGLVWSPGFGGDLTTACSNGRCSSETDPLGFLVGVRPGFQFASGIALELFIGYLQAEESATRSQTATAEQSYDPFTSSNYQDVVKLSGAVIAASASYRFRGDFPITLRTSAGVIRALGKFENGGTFTSKPREAAYPPGEPYDANTAPEITREGSVFERNETVWMPFIGPEARIGYQISDSLSVDLGVAVLAIFAPNTKRTDTRDDSPDGRRRYDTDQPETRQDPNECIPGTQSGSTCTYPGRFGIITLPSEDAFGTWFAVVPSISARWAF